MIDRELENIRKEVKYESDLKMLRELDNQILGISHDDPDKAGYYIVIVCILGLVASLICLFLE